MPTSKTRLAEGTDNGRAQGLLSAVLVARVFFLGVLFFFVGFCFCFTLSSLLLFVGFFCLVLVEPRVVSKIQDRIGRTQTSWREGVQLRIQPFRYNLILGSRPNYQSARLARDGENDGR